MQMNPMQSQLTKPQSPKPLRPDGPPPPSARLSQSPIATGTVQISPPIGSPVSAPAENVVDMRKNSLWDMTAEQVATVESNEVAQETINILI